MGFAPNAAAVGEAAAKKKKSLTEIPTMISTATPRLPSLISRGGIGLGRGS